MRSNFEFTLTVPQSWNYCAADLMNRYACADGRKGASFYYERCAVLEINGTKYKYERMKIKKNNDGTETVTVYLVEK